MKKHLYKILIFVTLSLIVTFPSALPSKTDILIRVDSVSSDNNGVFGNLDILLVEESKFSDAFLTSIGQIKRVN